MSLLPTNEPLNPSMVDDLRLAASKMTGAERRSFQAEMCIKYCRGSARKAESVFGWGRKNVQLGLHEKRSGIVCLGLQSAHSGYKKWEERFPLVAQTLREIAEAHAQQNPTFNNSIAYTRLTAASAIEQLKNLGYSKREIPAPSTMADILNRMGSRYLTFGSSYKTSDFMVDSLSEWWKALSKREKQQLELIQIKVDNGPENSGRRTQFLKRMGGFAEQTKKSIQLLYFPPYLAQI